jgi:hypothetical protein
MKRTPWVFYFPGAVGEFLIFCARPEYNAITSNQDWVFTLVNGIGLSANMDRDPVILHKKGWVECYRNTKENPISDSYYWFLGRDDTDYLTSKTEYAEIFGFNI